ncbi:hypothetical protein B0I33_102434 [Prauserella shujinwangii]|uniref:Uncharacterized protein n=2 Tax=Prauserella shujinwangii TaxID=1453103 RepID=A0A2T0M136_9PSEU|nr:hypothetical protein B0I33_102434 [Prauserella shujinwangii]
MGNDGECEQIGIMADQNSRKPSTEEAAGAPDKTEAESSESSGRSSGIRLAQVAAAALAAILAAFLASSLGVYGTVVGAGVLSVVTTVGSELLLRSMERTKHAARRTKEMALRVLPAETQRQVPGHHTFTYKQVPGTRRTRAFERAGAPWASTEATRYLPLPGQDPPGSDEPTVFLPKPEDAGEAPAGRNGVLGWLRRRWPLLLATSALAFVIGMGAVTAFEQVSGRALDGGSGSTVSRLVSGGGSGGSGDSGGTERAPGDDQRQEQPVAPTTSDSPTETQESEPTETSEPTEPSTPAEEEQEPTGEPGEQTATEPQTEPSP